MMFKAYLSLGSNMGDRKKNLVDAIDSISRTNDTYIIGVSNIYETDPVGYTEQNNFLNMAVAIETQLEPLKLLNELQRIETALKRIREIHWGPRTIDIDILLYGDLEVFMPPRLIIPHPRMFERAFVLVPLKDILTPGKTPRKINNTDINLLISKCSDKDGVRLYCKFQ